MQEISPEELEQIPQIDNLPQNQEIILPGNLGFASFPDGVKRPITQVIKRNDGAVTITMGAPEPPVAAKNPDEICKNRTNLQITGPE